MENIEKIEIPDEPKENVNIAKEAKTLSDLLKLSITEEKEFIPMDNFKFMAELYTSSAIYIARKIQDFDVVMNNYCNFIPYSIPEEQRENYNRHKEYMQFFCVDDEKIKKKFTKKIRKYFPFGKVEWLPFDGAQYKKLLKQEKKK